MPVAIQLFGSDPEIMGAMAKKIEGINSSFVDINMGCPVPKVVKNGEGSALMKTPELANPTLSATFLILSFVVLSISLAFSFAGLKPAY